MHDNIENLHEIASDITVEINDRSLNFEFDSGANITVISENELSGMNLDLTRSSKKLRVANGNVVDVVYKAGVCAAAERRRGFSPRRRAEQFIGGANGVNVQRGIFKI